MNQWPQLCILAFSTANGTNRNSSNDECNSNNGSTSDRNETCIGAIVCKAEPHLSKSSTDHYFKRSSDDNNSNTIRGYIGMLVVDKPCRAQGIGSQLLIQALEVMKCQEQCTEVTIMRTPRQ